jgi:hypothetical protein
VPSSHSRIVASGSGAPVSLRVQPDVLKRGAAVGAAYAASHSACHSPTRVAAAVGSGGAVPGVGASGASAPRATTYATSRVPASGCVSAATTAWRTPACSASTASISPSSMR